MNREAVVRIVVAVTTDFLGSARSAEAGPLDETTRLFGREGLLDSLGLVNLLLDLEQQLNEQHALSIALADDRAMSQTRSPFRTIGSLSDYIFTLANEQLAA
jgi:acyl carrier protein